MRRLMVLFLGVWVSCAFGQEARLTPLENALWKGTLDISIQGSLQNHFLANQMLEANVPEGFTQEKAKMDIDFTLQIQFLINPLGETTLLAEEHFDAEMTKNLEIKYRIPEERVLEGDIIVEDHVQIFESKDSTIEFARDASYDHDSLDMGEFIVRPSGRMDKRGEIYIEADLEFVYTGEGSYVFEKERQPPSEEYARLQEKANLTQVFRLPVEFSTSIKHRRKPVDGTLRFNTDIPNPFAHEKSEGFKRDLFNNNLAFTGTCKLEPIGQD